MASTGPPLHGLSRDVTLAVLSRLFIEELVVELARRNISFGGHSIKQESLVRVLKDVMTNEYRKLEPGKYPTHDVADDGSSEFTPDAELAKREQFQCQELQKYSQTLSTMCPSPNMENSSYTEAANQCHDEKGTNKDSETKLEVMCLEASAGASASLTNSVMSETATEGNTEMNSDSVGKETVSSATNRPGSPLNNVFSPKPEPEDDKTHNDARLYCIDPDFQSINSWGSAKENRTCQKPSDTMVYSFKDSAYGTDQRSDFVQHTSAQNVSFLFGIKREEEENTSQSHLIELDEGKETPEVTTMVAESKTVITDEHMQADVPITEPVPESSGHVVANCNDEKAALCMDANGQRCSYETEHDGNKSHSKDISDSHGFGNERAGSSEKASITCLEPQGISLYACNDCNYRTKYRSHLVKHTRVHTGERPFMCKYCDYKATQNTSLKRHMLLHSGMKPYKCRDCDYKTADKGNLVKHIRKHTGEKPYMCGELPHEEAYRRQTARVIRMWIQGYPES